MNKETSKKLLKYGAAAGVVLATAGAADAAVIRGQLSTDGVNWENEPISWPLSGEILYIDMDNDGITDFSILRATSSSSSKIGLYGNGTYSIAQSSGTNTQIGWGSWDLIKFKNHDIIDDQQPFDNIWATIIDTNTSPYDVFPETGGEGYAGVYFKGNDGKMHYGWIKMDVNLGAETCTVYDCAYEATEDYPIAAGDMKTVPLTPLATAAGFGLIGLFGALKRRKKKLA